MYEVLWLDFGAAKVLFALELGCANCSMSLTLAMSPESRGF
jgi:hypothetical protein